MKKKVFIYSYSNYNLGDDLFVKTLCERYPEVQFYTFINDPNYEEVFSDIVNITIYSKRSKRVKLIKSVLRRIKNRDKEKDNVSYILSHFCSCLVLIGGSLFMQPTGSWIKHCVASEHRIVKNKPFYLIGSNFGPYSHPEFYENYEKLFSRFTDICFRDLYSYQLFNHLVNVRIAPDVLFDMRYKKQPKLLNQIGISVISLKNREDCQIYSQPYLDKIVEIVKYYIQRGYLIKLFSFCRPEGDEEAMEEIIEELKDSEKANVTCCYYRGNMEQTMDELQKSSFVVATRFHCMILGWVFNIPVFPIIYSNKMLNVINDMNFTGHYATLQNIVDLSPNDVNYNLRNNIVLDISETNQKAKLQFQGLDEFIHR